MYPILSCDLWLSLDIKSASSMLKPCAAYRAQSLLSSRMTLAAASWSRTSLATDYSELSSSSSPDYMAPVSLVWGSFTNNFESESVFN